MSITVPRRGLTEEQWTRLQPLVQEAFADELSTRNADHWLADPEAFKRMVARFVEEDVDFRFDMGA